MEKLIHKNLRTVCYAILACAFGSSVVASAAEVDSLTTVVRFRLAQSRIDTIYQGNGQTISHFKSFIDSIGTDAVHRIEVRSWASPEGLSPLNRKLVAGRAEATSRLITDMYPQLANRLFVEEKGEAWNELLQAVKEDTSLSGEDRKSIQAVMDKDGLALDEKKAMLAQLPCYGRLWAKLYGGLRKSVVCTFYETKGHAHVSPVDTLTDTLLAKRDTIGIFPSPSPGASVATGVEQDVASESPFALTEAGNHRGGFIEIKTNMLYDAALIPNIGIEIPLGRHGSLSADWMYAWWRNNRRHRYWRAYGGELEGRYWCRAAGAGQTLHGHHLGLYAQMLTFDVEWGGRGYMGGKSGGTLWNKAIVGGGLSYGYSLSLTHRLCMDFSIGIGYMGGQYQEYVPNGDCYVWQRTNRLRYFGPTRAEVSLVWWLPYGQNRKGGMK